MKNSVRLVPLTSKVHPQLKLDIFEEADHYGVTPSDYIATLLEARDIKKRTIDTESLMERLLELRSLLSERDKELVLLKQQLAKSCSLNSGVGRL